MTTINIKSSSVLVVFSCLAAIFCGMSAYNFFYTGLLPFIEQLIHKDSYDFSRKMIIQNGTGTIIFFLLAILLAIFANISHRN
jgi:uncharacterized membrane protein YccF (DUF307 family)